MLLRLGRSGLVKCQCSWGRAGLDLSKPLGLGRSGLDNPLVPDRPGLVNALKERVGQA